MPMKKKHNPPRHETTAEEATISNSQALLSPRCQSPSDLNNGENVEQLDPFGLNTQAGRWLKAEQHYYKSRVDTTYFPGTKEIEVEEKLRDAPMEAYARRLQEPMSENSSPVLLISTNVSKNWVPPESVGKFFRFLIFPQVDGSPLFLTYMPGQEHGAAVAFVHGSIGYWTKKNKLLASVLGGGLSSGNYGTFQPDIRIFPNTRNRDNDSDKDKKNNGVPYSRLICEVENQNRNPVAIRQCGKLYMKCSYTRLFLACNIYYVSPDDGGRLRAGVVLWGKANPEDNVVSVLAAVSFGTEDLTEVEKGEFEKARADRLVGVGATQWTRPRHTENLGEMDDHTPDDWKLRIPYQNILYKVKAKRSGKRRYLLDVLIDDDEVADLVIDLRQLALQICQPCSDSEDDEE